MKESKFVALAVLLSVAVVGGLSVQADTNVLANGVTWAYTYEGNVLPDNAAANPVWTKLFNTAATETVSNGILTIDGPALTDYVDYEIGPSPWSPTAAGTTIEFRLKVDSEVANTPRGAQSLIAYAGSTMYYIGLATNKVFDALLGGASSIPMDTTDAFHTYRLTINGLTGTGTFYVDGNPTPAFTTPGVSLSPAQTHLDFGVNSANEAGKVEWDYIRWSNAGVFPAPEASTCTLVILGAIAMLHRWKR